MASSNHSCLCFTFGAPNLDSRNRATHHFRKLVRNSCSPTVGRGYILYCHFVFEEKKKRTCASSHFPQKKALSHGYPSTLPNKWKQIQHTKRSLKMTLFEENYGRSWSLEMMGKTYKHKSHKKIHIIYIYIHINTIMQTHLYFWCAGIVFPPLTAWKIANILKPKS